MEAEMEAEKEFQDREDKKKQLFQDQKQLLDTFLEHGAISQAQYDKSLGDLIVKMGSRLMSAGRTNCLYCRMSFVKKKNPV